MPDIVTTRIFADGEKNITAAKLNDVIGSSVIQTSFVGAKPVASSIGSTDNLLLLTAGGTYAQVPFSTLSSAISGAIGDTEIWNVRLRSFNAVGNPNFELDQRNVGNSITATNGLFCQDRWNIFQPGGAGRCSSQRMPGNIPVPGTNFLITQSFLRFTVATAQATLAASDGYLLQQAVEGPILRELLGDVNSISILCRSSVANLKFGLNLQSASGTIVTIGKLCSLGAANTWTLLTFPALPVWSASGTWSVNPGSPGYYLYIVLAAGSGNLVPSNDTWVTTPNWGAVGQSNFLATSGSTFDVAFVQHEPGAVCSILMDKPFSVNYDECLRYYCKSYDYATAVGATSANGYRGIINPVTSAANYIYPGATFLKTMAKAPTAVIYNHATGAANSLQQSTGTNYTIAATGTGQTNITYIQGTSFAANGQFVFHFTADSGW